MYSRVLIPVNEPSEVEPLIRFSSVLLDAEGSIRVLHVIQQTSLPNVTREWRQSINFVIPAHETGAALDVQVDPDVRAALDIPGEILESQEQGGIDAIVLTLRGDKRSRNPFVGHTASALLHHARCDVLIVNRLAMASDKIPRILIPTFTEEPSSKALRVAEEIALHNQGAPIVVLSMSAKASSDGVEESSEETSRGVPLTRKLISTPVSLLNRRRRLPDMIVRAAARERYGLLLVAEESLHAEAPLLTRSFLEELFRAAPCPVLAVRG